MRIAVVGDILLDIDLTGRAERLSPDAPVPVVAVEAEQRRPGGAGLVAMMLARDGVDVALVTALAGDEAARRLRTEIERASAESTGSIELVAAASAGRTPVKTRVRAADHAVVRLDEGDDEPVVAEATAAMLAALDGVDAIVVADYGRGVTADERLRAALSAAAQHVPLVWDPHPRGTAPVPGTAVATPNLAEARTFAGIAGSGIPAAADAAAALAERWGTALLVTLGGRGALLQPADSAAAPHVVPGVAFPAADTCGAGDRLAASVAAALASGRDLADAAQIGVAAASAFVSGGGVAALAAPPRLRAVPAEADAFALARTVRARGGTVVATGGCFDLLHAGHARTLAAARALGDCLVVCINSDDSVRRLKGPERPIMGQDDRRDLLLALECVDAVAIFDESTPEAVLERLTPHLWVKGGDYVAEQLPETATIARWGGRTVTVPYHPGRSTTLLAGALARVG